VEQEKLIDECLSLAGRLCKKECAYFLWQWAMYLDEETFRCLQCLDRYRRKEQIVNMQTNSLAFADCKESGLSGAEFLGCKKPYQGC
jgi:hypothetical protein